MWKKGRILFLLVIVCSLTSQMAFGQKWDTAGSGEAVESCEGYDNGCLSKVKIRYGELSVTTIGENEFRILFNGREVSTLAGTSLYIQEKFTVGKKELALLALNSGGMACPMEMFIIEISDGSTPIISSSFGTCTDYYKASIQDDSLIIRMPSYFNPMHLNDLNEKERLQIEKRPGSVFRWSDSKLTEKEEQ